MIVVPDDFPSVFEGSEAHALAGTLGAVRVCGERGAEDETELARRIGEARIAVNIRAYARFSDAVFAACLLTAKPCSMRSAGTGSPAAAKRAILLLDHRCNCPPSSWSAAARPAASVVFDLRQSPP